MKGLHGADSQSVAGGAFRKLHQDFNPALLAHIREVGKVEGSRRSNFNVSIFQYKPKQAIHQAEGPMFPEHGFKAHFQRRFPVWSVVRQGNGRTFQEAFKIEIPNQTRASHDFGPQCFAKRRPRRNQMKDFKIFADLFGLFSMLVFSVKQCEPDARIDQDILHF
ncbi:MAG: hypothetical protein ACLFPR_02110 [Desulfococcaceae bacterium]